MTGVQRYLMLSVLGLSACAAGPTAHAPTTPAPARVPDRTPVDARPSPDERSVEPPARAEGAGLPAPQRQTAESHLSGLPPPPGHESSPRSKSLPAPSEAPRGATPPAVREAYGDPSGWAPRTSDADETTSGSASSVVESDQPNACKKLTVPHSAGKNPE